MGRGYEAPAEITNWGPNPKRSREMKAAPMRNPTWIMTNSEGRSFRFARTRCSPGVAPTLSRRRRLDLCASASNGWFTRSRSVGGRAPKETAATFPSSSDAWILCGRASAIAAMSTPAAASAEESTTSDISAGRSGGWKWLEHRCRQCLAPFGEMVQVHGAVAGRCVEALDVALFVDACLAELKQLMRLRLAVGEPCHLTNAHDLPRSTTHTLGLDDHIDRRPDLLLNGARWKVGAGHQDHRFQAADRVLRTVCVDGAHRAFVTGVHGLEHVKGLAASAFAHHDPIGPHPQRVADEVPDLDCALALDVGRPGFQADYVRLPQLKLRCILDGDDALVGGDVARDDVEQRRLARRRPTRDKNAEPAPYGGFEKAHHVGRCRPHRQQIRRPQLFPRELPNRHAWAFEGERRQDHIHSRAITQPRVAHG